MLISALIAQEIHYEADSFINNTLVLIGPRSECVFRQGTCVLGGGGGVMECRAVRLQSVD